MEWKTESLGDMAFMISDGISSSEISAYYENGVFFDTEIKITQAGLDNSSAKI